MRNYELEVPISKNNDALEKDDEKCISCGYCRKVCTNDITVARIFEIRKDAEPICVDCGQCANICPTEAIHEKFDYKRVKKILHNKNGKTIIFSVAPAVRVALGEDLGLNVGINVEKKIPAMLKKLGADYVFDITFGADLTIMEEAMEFVNRIKKDENLPMFTSCCPAWVKYAEIFYPEIIPNLSSVKSPISIQSAIIKTFFAKEKGLNPEDIIHIVIAPCTAKKAEIKREELKPQTDYILTTREFANLLKEEQVDISNIIDNDFDIPFETGSGSGVLFGNSGGVLEAALRTAYYYLTGKNLTKEELTFTELRGMKGIKESKIIINDKTIKVVACNGMKNAKTIIDKVIKKESDYDFIEVMNCFGGCISGGGQPKITMLDMNDTKVSRMNSIYDEDEIMTLRLCHENPEIIYIYEKYLEKPNSNLSKELLHTTYYNKSYLIGGEND